MVFPGYSRFMARLFERNNIERDIKLNKKKKKSSIFDKILSKYRKTLTISHAQNTDQVFLEMNCKIANCLFIPIEYKTMPAFMNTVRKT